MCRSGHIYLSGGVQIGHRGYRATSRERLATLVLFAMLGKNACVDGVPAAPSDVDDFLTDAGYFLMILGHQSRYDLF
jgi:hypothetical protein